MNPQLSFNDDRSVNEVVGVRYVCRDVVPGEAFIGSGIYSLRTLI